MQAQIQAEKLRGLRCGFVVAGNQFDDQSGRTGRCSWWPTSSSTPCRCANMSRRERGWCERMVTALHGPELTFALAPVAAAQGRRCPAGGKAAADGGVYESSPASDWRWPNTSPASSPAQAAARRWCWTMAMMRSGGLFRNPASRSAATAFARVPCMTRARTTFPPMWISPHWRQAGKRGGAAVWRARRPKAHVPGQYRHHRTRRTTDERPIRTLRRDILTATERLIGQ